MGLFDFFKSKGSAKPQTVEADTGTILKHAERVLDKRAMSYDRFPSIEYLCKLGTAEAWRAVLPRYNFTVDPSITDQEEKQYIYESISANPKHALEPVKEYLRTTESLNWPLKMLRALVSDELFVAELLAQLSKFDTGYEKNADRKLQLIKALEGIKNETILPAVSPFIEDFDEDIRFQAVHTMVSLEDPSAREPLQKLLLEGDSVRVRTAVVEGFAERGWTIDEPHLNAVSRLLPSVPTGMFVLNSERKIVRR